MQYSVQVVIFFAQQIPMFYIMLFHWAAKVSPILYYFVNCFLDGPNDVSTMGKYKDGFEDILQERRITSDFKYSLRTRTEIPQYKYNKDRTPAKLKEDVLKSDRVKCASEQVKSIFLSKVYKIV